MRVWLSLLFLSAGALAALSFYTGGLSGIGPAGPSPPQPADAAQSQPTPSQPAATRRQPPTAAPDQKSASRTPPPEPTPEEDARPPWGVQLAADFDRERALAQFTRARKRFASVLGAHEPTIVRERNLSIGRKARFVVQVSAQSREAAQELCQRLRDSGGACIVIKN